MSVPSVKGAGRCCPRRGAPRAGAPRRPPRRRPRSPRSTPGGGARGPSAPPRARCRGRDFRPRPGGGPLCGRRSPTPDRRREAVAQPACDQPVCDLSACEQRACGRSACDQRGGADAGAPPTGAVALPTGPLVAPPVARAPPTDLVARPPGAPPPGAHAGAGDPRVDPARSVHPVQGVGFGCRRRCVDAPAGAGTIPCRRRRGVVGAETIAAHPGCQARQTWGSTVSMLSRSLVSGRRAVHLAGAAATTPCPLRPGADELMVIAPRPGCRVLRLHPRPRPRRARRGVGAGTGLYRCWHGHCWHGHCWHADRRHGERRIRVEGHRRCDAGAEIRFRHRLGRWCVEGPCQAFHLPRHLGPQTGCALVSPGSHPPLRCAGARCHDHDRLRGGHCGDLPVAGDAPMLRPWAPDESTGRRRGPPLGAGRFGPRRRAASGRRVDQVLCRSALGNNANRGNDRHRTLTVSVTPPANVGVG